MFCFVCGAWPSRHWSSGKNVRPSRTTDEEIITFLLVIAISGTCQIVGTSLAPPAKKSYSSLDWCFLCSFPGCAEHGCLWSVQLSSSAPLQHLQTASKHHSSKSQTNVWAGWSSPLTPPLPFTSLLTENGTITKTRGCVGQEHMLYLETDKRATWCLFLVCLLELHRAVWSNTPPPSRGTGQICSDGIIRLSFPK